MAVNFFRKRQKLEKALLRGEVTRQEFNDRFAEYCRQHRLANPWLYRRIPNAFQKPRRRGSR